MRYTEWLAWDRPTIALTIIAATAVAFALFTLSLSLAQGSPGVFQQVDYESPTTMEECRQQLDAGKAVLCKRNSFSVKTIRPDGGFSIDWSKWASRYGNVDRYSIQRYRFMYRYGFQLEDTRSPVNAADYTVPDVNSCVPRAAETNDAMEVTRWAWQCNGISQVYEDPFGEPTSIEQLQGFSDNWTTEHWTGSLLAPGRKADAPVKALRIPGSKTDAHVDNPQGATDRLAQQDVDDGTHDLLATEVEMHLYLITVHFDDGRTQRRYELVDGGPFADR